MSAMHQFENYPDQQPMVPATFWRVQLQPGTLDQPTSLKKPPKGVGHSQGFQQNMPPVADPLDEIYVWDDRLSVLRFVEENRLRGLLLEARQPLDSAFGRDAIKTLSLERDDEGFDTLFCLVRTRAQLEIATGALRVFDERWWLARSEEAAGKVNFDFDLV